MARTRPVDPTTDLGLLSLVVATGVTERIAERLADAGFDDVRDSHGYVVQGLLAGDTTVTHLAARLGISAQAVSKTVARAGAGGLRRAWHRRHRPAGRARSASPPAASSWSTRRDGRASRSLATSNGGSAPVTPASSCACCSTRPSVTAGSSSCRRAGCDRAPEEVRARGAYGWTPSTASHATSIRSVGTAPEATVTGTA